MTTSRRAALAAAALFLAACTPPAQDAAVAPPTATAPTPPTHMAETFKDCAWGEVRAAGVSIWSFACPTDKLAPDEALPGFQRVRGDGAGGLTPYPAIRFFAKAPDAPLEAVLPDVRAASPGPATATCAFEPAPGDDPAAFVLMPTGEARAAYDAFIKGEAAEPSMPCGPLGPSEAGVRLFKLVPGAPDKVAMIDAGSDIAIFDWTTLKAAP